MVPGKSALTVTPWIAVAVPITANVEGQVSFCATTVVTAVAGSWKLAPWAIAASTCLNFANPRPPIRAANTTNIRIILFAIRSPKSGNKTIGNRLGVTVGPKQHCLQIDFTTGEKDSEFRNALLADRQF